MEWKDLLCSKGIDSHVASAGELLYYEMGNPKEDTMLCLVSQSGESGEIVKNGYSNQEAPDRQGRILDYGRIDYLCRHLGQCIRARESGIPLTAYYVWPFLDDLEWTGGYTTRMGLVRVDYETQERTLKESARWYARVIRERRLVEESGG